MLDGALNFVLYWDRALYDNEMRSLTLNPHQIWNDGGRVLYLPEPYYVEHLSHELQAGTVRVRVRPDTSIGRAQLKVVLLNDAGVSQGESSWIEVDTVTKTLTADITATGSATRFKLLKQGYGGDWIPFFW